MIFWICSGFVAVCLIDANVDFKAVLAFIFDTDEMQALHIASFPLYLPKHLIILGV